MLDKSLDFQAETFAKRLFLYTVSILCKTFKPSILYRKLMATKPLAVQSKNIIRLRIRV